MRPARVLSGLAAALLAVTAHAHAFLDHASPRVGSTVQAPPSEVRLWFTQELEPAFSSIDVLDAAGQKVAAGRAQVDAKDRTQLQIALPSLSPGVYTVAWRVVSVDTHVTQGRFTFRIGS